MRFDFTKYVQSFGCALEFTRNRVRQKPAPRLSLNDRRIVIVGHQRALLVSLMGRPDHTK